MKILYCDLNAPDFSEYYGHPDKYGGGACFAREAIKLDKNFFIAAKLESFEKMPESYKDQCIILSNEEIESIKNGAPIKTINSVANIIDSVDIICHHHSNVYINIDGIKAKQCVWPVGWRETVHANHKNVLLFDEAVQNPHFQSQCLIFPITIGVPKPIFSLYKKEDLMFSCARLAGSYQTRELANICNKLGIKLVLAGILDNGYRIDDLLSEHVSYLGPIDQAAKNYYNAIAKFCPQFQNYPISVTLSAKEALFRGTPIMATPVGGWNSFIKNGENGFIVSNVADIVTAWNKRDEISQEKCYNSADIFSSTQMIQSFYRAFEAIFANE